MPQSIDTIRSQQVAATISICAARLWTAEYVDDCPDWSKTFSRQETVPLPRDRLLWLARAVEVGPFSAGNTPTPCRRRRNLKAVGLVIACLVACGRVSRRLDFVLTGREPIRPLASRSRSASHVKTSMLCACRRHYYNMYICCRWLANPPPPTPSICLKPASCSCNRHLKRSSAAGCQPHAQCTPARCEKHSLKALLILQNMPCWTSTQWWLHFPA
jgi:hypothetical protein